MIKNPKIVNMELTGLWISVRFANKPRQKYGLFIKF